MSQYLDYRKKSTLREERSLPCMLIFTLVSVGNLGRAYLKDMKVMCFIPSHTLGLGLPWKRVSH